jgi:chromosome segregation ATPase
MIQRMPMRDLRVMHRSYHDGISQLIEDHEDLQDRYRRAREELSQARNRIQELEKQMEERR